LNQGDEMNENQQTDTEAAPSDTMSSFFQAVREDVLMLALLHDRELDRQTLMGLWKDCFEDFLGLRLQSEPSQVALRLFRQGLNDLPTDLDQKTLDILATEYADIYLNYSLNTSPCESVWVDEDGLTMQDAMFQIREWYTRHGLAVENWRMRSDDHLVTQLQFVAYLFEDVPNSARLGEIARFLDEHLLRWIGEFAQRVSARCKTRLYAGLASLTAAYLEELREIAAQLLDSPRPGTAEIDERMRPKRIAAGVAVSTPSPFVPGAAPSW
jgi:TorA maturation chaperone TorD